MIMREGEEFFVIEFKELEKIWNLKSNIFEKHL
jgi:hypothetical protein